MNKYILHPRFEGSRTKASLDNSDIIAIVGIFASIFASIIATLFSVWLLDKLRKRYNRPGPQDLERAAESLEANVYQGPPSHQSSPTSFVHSLQDLEASAISIQSAQNTSIIISGTEIPQEHAYDSMVRSAPIENGSSSRPGEPLEHPLEERINRPERAYTWNADRAVLERPGVGTSHNKD